MELSLNEFLTEAEVMEFMGIENKDRLQKLRTRENMPYIRITKPLRMYYVPDLLKWLLERRRNYSALD